MEIPPPREYPIMLKPPSEPAVHESGDDVIARRIWVE
jgi:hypothetical protein